MAQQTPTDTAPESTATGDLASVAAANGRDVERLAVAGSGRIACGLATVAADHGEVVLWARSSSSAQRAHDGFAKRGGATAANITVTTDISALRDATFVVEAIVEETEAKAALYGQLAGLLAEDAIMSTTTSALSVEGLATASGRPDRFAALHVFNPVTKMALVELCFPQVASAATRKRAHALCVLLGKTAVEVPDVSGFVVNRLLFPYLFDAVRLQEETGMAPEAIDACMALGAGHPSGPLRLLDFVGLDVAVAIAHEIDVEVPARVKELVAEGALGRKTGRGFYDHRR
jgi:3-hydroxybutyryl-CoA dehydrogenase